MQYILTQEEMDKFVPKKDLDKANVAIAALRTMVVPQGKCVHDSGGPTYCDNCPVSYIGNNPANINYELSKVMCPLERNYSK